MEKISISDLLIRIKNSVVIEDKVQYKRVTIKSKNAGIVLRDIKYGHDIGTKKQFIINKGQFLLSKIDARNGAFGIVGQELDGAIITGNFWTYEVNKERLNIEWFNIFVSSSKFISICDKASSGTTNRRYLDESKFLNYQINLPSLNEQNIFVKKYKELSSKLDLINNKINIEKKYLKKLRNSILEDAVQGKLVEQDPNDEPAEVLLEKIREEKEKLIKEKKIKKEKALPEISEEEKPFKLPKGWSWERLGECSLLNPRNNVDDNLEVSFIPMKLINDGFDNKHTSERRIWKEIKNGFTHFSESDIVVAKITPCFENRKSAIMQNLINGVGAGTTELYVIRCFQETILPKFILSIFKTEKFISGGVETYTGTAGQQRVKKDYLRNLVIAVPPLAEQKRIVEKVDSLMALCDELEKKIEEQKEYSNKLMESIIKNSF